MAEAATLVGLAAAISQFLEYGFKLVERINELSSVVQASSSLFSALRIRLPIVLRLLTRIQSQIEADGMGESDAEVLNLLVGNSISHVMSLLSIIEKFIPSTKESTFNRYHKAMRSLSFDKKVQRIGDRLQEDLQILSLYQTTSLVDLSYRMRQNLVLTESSRNQKIDQDPCYSTIRQIHGLDLKRQEEVFDDVSDKSVRDATHVSVDGIDERVLGSARLVPNGQSNQQQVSVSTRRTARVPLLEGPERSEQQSPIHDSASVERSSRCQSSCSCVCHRPRQIRTPCFFNHVFGHLTVNIGGQLIISEPCTERKCERKGHFAARINYRFPQWVLARAVHATVTSTALSTKSYLNTLRVLPDSAEVFSVVSRGDLAKLRSMFKDGQASIYDVNRQNWTLLHSAFNLERTDIYQFLLTEGADVGIDADNGSNVVERAWFFAQTSTKTPGEYVMCDNEVLRRVDLDDFVQSQQYSLIHKIVLGITKLSLSSLLEASTSEIDRPDVRGRTGLWWASAQGNIPALSTLLEYGANPEIATTFKQAPLHIARNTKVAQLLIQHGARVDRTDSVARTPLHCYCYRQMWTAAELAEEILKSGASIDARASGGQTPLHYATMFGKVHLFPALWQYGADINAIKANNTTPIMDAVRYDKHEAVRALLDRAADITIPNLQGQNILHVGAVYAGAKTLEVLARADLRRIHMNGTDTNNFTARDYFEQRKLRSEELVVAFENLMNVACAAEDLTCNSISDSDEEREASGVLEIDDLKMPGVFPAT